MNLAKKVKIYGGIPFQRQSYIAKTITFQMFDFKMTINIIGNLSVVPTGDVEAVHFHYELGGDLY